MSIQKEWLDFLREQFVEAKSAPHRDRCAGLDGGPIWQPD